MGGTKFQRNPDSGIIIQIHKNHEGDDIQCAKYSIEYRHNKGDDIWCTNLLSIDIVKVMTFSAQIY